MPAKGSGVQSLEDLRARCRVSDINDCWRWQGALHDGHAAIWMFDPVAGKSVVVSGARAGAIVGGLKLFRGWRAWLTCTRHDCCNPSHVMTGPHAKWGQWMAVHGRMKENRAHRIAIQKAMERKYPERAQAARAVLEAPDDVRNVELVRALGLPKDVVSAIRLGQRWAHLRGPSPWGGLGG